MKIKPEDLPRIKQTLEMSEAALSHLVELRQALENNPDLPGQKMAARKIDRAINVVADMGKNYLDAVREYRQAREELIKKAREEIQAAE